MVDPPYLLPTNCQPMSMHSSPMTAPLNHHLSTAGLVDRASNHVGYSIQSCVMPRLTNVGSGGGLWARLKGSRRRLGLRPTCGPHLTPFRLHSCLPSSARRGTPDGSPAPTRASGGMPTSGGSPPWRGVSEAVARPCLGLAPWRRRPSGYGHAIAARLRRSAMAAGAGVVAGAPRRIMAEGKGQAGVLWRGIGGEAPHLRPSSRMAQTLEVVAMFAWEGPSKVTQ